MIAVIVSVEGFVSIDTGRLFIYQKSVSPLKLVCVSSHASIAFRAHSPVSPPVDSYRMRHKLGRLSVEPGC